MQEQSQKAPVNKAQLTIRIDQYIDQSKVNPTLQKLVAKNEMFLKSRGKVHLYDEVIEEIDQRKIRIGNKWLIDFASCNYLGFDLDPEIMDSIPEQVKKWGTHPSWSRMIGSPRLYETIEERLTELLKVPDCLLFPNITMINQHCIFVLAEGGEIFLDKYSHRTLYEGAAIARGFGTQMTYFKSDDWNHLENLLKNSTAKRKLICVDGVYSMHGKYPDIKTAAALARKYDAILYVDDAHGFGVIGERAEDELCPYGKRGNGIINYAGESYENVIFVTGLSKSYSSYLAVISCDPATKHYLKSVIAPYLYSGPSPTATLATALKGLEVNEKRGDTIRADLYRKSAKLNRAIHQMGLRNDNDTDFPIFNIYIENPDQLDFMANWLFEKGIYPTLCPYPMVPKTDVGFRIQITASNTEEEVDTLIQALKDLNQIIPIQKQNPPSTPHLKVGTIKRLS